MISVIIPTLNEERYIGDLIALIQKESFSDFEIIVSDGNSSDKTVATAKASGCVIVTSTKSSPAIQRNTGVKKSHGDILIFLDADTRFAPGALTIALEKFKTEKLDVASFYFDFDSKKISYRLLHAYGTILIYMIHFIHPVALGAGIIVKRTWFDTVGGFDEVQSIGEDHLFAKSIQLCGGRYDLLHVPIIFFSLRRFHREGFWTVFLKWHYFALYYAIHGPFSKNIVPYEFGKYN